MAPHREKDQEVEGPSWFPDGSEMNLRDVNTKGPSKADFRVGEG